MLFLPSSSSASWCSDYVMVRNIITMSLSVMTLRDVLTLSTCNNDDNEDPTSLASVISNWWQETTLESSDGTRRQNGPARKFLLWRKLRNCMCLLLVMPNFIYVFPAGSKFCKDINWLDLICETLLLTYLLFTCDDIFG